MGSKTEEDFILKHLPECPSNLLELGPGNCILANKIIDRHKVTAIDLFPSPADIDKRILYFCGNFLDVSLTCLFDMIFALSSFEHAGLQGFGIDLTEYIRVAEKLVTILKPGGKLVLTVPAGVPDIIVVGKTCRYFTTEDTDWDWGARIFDVPSLCSIFSSLKPIDIKAYLALPEGHREIDPIDLSKYRFLEQRALLCVAFIKE